MYNYSLIVHSTLHTDFLHIVNVGGNPLAVRITCGWGGCHKCGRLFSSRVLNSVQTLYTSETLQRKYCKASFIQGDQGQI
jgi:hypothetical protein